MISTVRSIAGVLGTLLVAQAIGVFEAHAEPAGLVTVHCNFPDGLATSIRTPRRELPDMTLRTLRAHCAVQRAQILGGVVDLGTEVGLDIQPMGSLPTPPTDPEDPGGPGEGDDPFGGTMPQCGEIYYDKKETAACMNDEGVEGVMTTTYSCRVVEVPKLVGTEWQCVGDPSTETCVYVSDSDCITPDEPEGTETAF